MALKTISNRRRFEIFKRDGFTCRYCGRKAPEVVLELDHVKPQVESGTDEDSNLVAACHDCNNGKGGIPLDVIKAGPSPQVNSERGQDVCGALLGLAIKRFWISHRSEVDEVRDAIAEALAAGISAREIAGLIADSPEYYADQFHERISQTLIAANRKRG